MLGLNTEATMQDSLAMARKQAQEHRDRMVAAMAVTDRRIEPAGIPTAVLEGGDGPPIILLHGAGEFAATWMRVIPDLTATHRVVAPDLPGHGASGIPNDPLDADQMMSWLAGVIEATCPEPPVLVGHLLGGALAARYVCDTDAPPVLGRDASDHGAARAAHSERSPLARWDRGASGTASPERPPLAASHVGAAGTASPQRSPLAASGVGVARTAPPDPSRPRAAGLVLVDSFGLAPLRPALRFALALAGFMALPNERTQHHLFRRCFADFDGLREEMSGQWDDLSAYALYCARTPAMQTALRHLMPQLALSAIPSEELARIRVPSSLIWGRHDLQVRLLVAIEASARYGWPLHVIEHAAADPAFEQPGAFLDALHTELRTAEPAG